MSSQPNPDNSVNITCSTDGVALYVVLTTLAHGRFSDNAMLVLPPGQTVLFYPFGALDLPLLTSSLRVEHLAAMQYGA